MFDGDVAFVLGTGPAGTAEPGRFLELADAADEAIREAVERSVRR
jgi:L-aminopeptidase/D-esterase-like protein